MTKEELTQAVTRADETMDSDLVTAIVDEVLKELDKAVLSEDTLFDRIWQATKHWDLDTGRAVPGHPDCKGYAGMSGDDVRVIMDAIAAG